MDLACPHCGYERRYVYQRIWPFNFRLVDCANCSEATIDERGLWYRLMMIMELLVPFNGWLHAKRHPWWDFAPKHE